MRAVPLDETQPFPIIEVVAPAGWDADDVQHHLDISDAASSYLDVPDWASRASRPMSTMDLSDRMSRCEVHVLYGIVEPLAKGNIALDEDA